MTIRTTLITSSLIVAAGTFAFAHPTEVAAGPITTYNIDPDRSYVGTYVPEEWMSGGNARRGVDGDLGKPWTSGGAGGTGDLDGDLGNVSWSRGWKPANFKLSGSFSLETVLSDWVPTSSRLYLREQAIVTDAPGYAGFSLPYFFAKQNDQVSNSSDPCFDFSFNFDPSMMWSCSGWSDGGSQSDEGTLENGVLTVDGMASIRASFLTDFIELPLGIEPDPDTPVNYDAVAGEFWYHMVAVEEAAAVPEPTTVLLIVGGLGVMGGLARWRKATTA